MKAVLLFALALSLCLQQTDPQEDPSEQLSEEEEDFFEYSMQLAQYMPTETFAFSLEKEEKIIIWPKDGARMVRGWWHVEDGDEESQANVLVEHNGATIKQTERRKLGVFSMNLTEKDDIRLTFTKETEGLTEVYFSFQLIFDKPQTDSSDIARVQQKFEKVAKILMLQESEMKRTLEMNHKNKARIERHLKHAVGRIVTETVAMFVSGLVSLLLLQRQLKKGYELLV